MTLQNLEQHLDCFFDTHTHLVKYRKNLEQQIKNDLELINLDNVISIKLEQKDIINPDLNDFRLISITYSNNKTFINIDHYVFKANLAISLGSGNVPTQTE